MVEGTQISVTVAVKGKHALYSTIHKELQFPVIILDARKVWGRVDALITPVGGRGEKWVAAEQLVITE